jgi:GntR family transcriptional regulator
MPLDFTISPGSPAPIFRQIIDQVRLAVAGGRLTEGDQLPSVRALAENLLVNPNTIAKAYNELSRDGYLLTHPGRGVFVARPRQVYTKAERLRRVAPLIDALVSEAVSLNFSTGEILESVETALSKLNLPPTDPSRRKS